MKSLLALAAISLLSGCTAGNVYHVDSRFTPEEEQAIQQANEMWCSASRGQLCMDLVFGARVDVNEVHRNAIVKSGDRAASYRFRETIEREEVRALHDHSALESHIIVVLYERTDPANLRTTVAHEMGHAFGIVPHVEDPSAIMYHDLSGAADKEAITCSDLRAAGVACDTH